MFAPDRRHSSLQMRLWRAGDRLKRVYRVNSCRFRKEEKKMLQKDEYDVNICVNRTTGGKSKTDS